MDPTRSFQRGWQRVEVFRQKFSGRRKGKSSRHHPKELFGARWIFNRSPGGDIRVGRAQVGPKPESGSRGEYPDLNRTATPADSLDEGKHHVRTLYGEGTARDLLRAV